MFSLSVGIQECIVLKSSLTIFQEKKCLIVFGSNSYLKTTKGKIITIHSEFMTLQSSSILQVVAGHNNTERS